MTEAELDALPDNFTLANARKMADRIRGYWQGRLGCDVQTRVEMTGEESRSYWVRSDMVNGLPRVKS